MRDDVEFVVCNKPLHPKGPHLLDLDGVDACLAPAMYVQGQKFDTEKPRWDLVPWGAVSEVVKVLTCGAKKYGVDNWKLVPDWRRRYFAAACRHLISWTLGEKTDPETGLHHLAHAACCVLFCIELDKEK